MKIAFDVYGLPAPQGSKRFVGTSKSGRGILVESSAKVKPWREDVRAEAALAMNARFARLVLDQRDHGAPVVNPFPIDAPVRMAMVFTMPKPKSAPKRRRTYPDRTPDLSKLVRSTEDALVSAGLLKDDARIVDYTRVAKVYPLEDPDALSAPGVRITIEVITGG